MLDRVQVLQAGSDGSVTCSSLPPTLTTVDSNVGNVGAYSSIAVPSDGRRVISYYDTTNGNLKMVKCGNASCSNGNTITAIDNVNTFGSFVSGTSSVVIPSDGRPVISYHDVNNGKLKVVKCSNAACLNPSRILMLDRER